MVANVRIRVRQMPGARAHGRCGGVRVRADRWQRARGHFLVRDDFEARLTGTGANNASVERATLMEGFLALGLVAGCCWLIREATERLCPPAVTLFDYCAAVLRRVFARIWRTVVGWCWIAPVRRYGVGVTLWVWLLVIAAATSTCWLVKPEWRLFKGVLTMWSLVVGSWMTLRWWAERCHRARELPARRVRIR